MVLRRRRPRESNGCCIVAAGRRTAPKNVWRIVCEECVLFPSGIGDVESSMAINVARRNTVNLQMP